MTVNNIESWQFGHTQDESDYLVSLILQGKKTATSCLYSDDYSSSKGEKFYIADFHGHKKALIELVEVEVKRFCDVDSSFALKEGEGDLSLAYWRSEHERFFKKELASQSKDFSEDILIVCEEFKLVETY